MSNSVTSKFVLFVLVSFFIILSSLPIKADESSGELVAQAEDSTFTPSPMEETPVAEESSDESVDESVYVPSADGALVEE
jgi:hypothetical protein